MQVGSRICERIDLTKTGFRLPVFIQSLRIGVEVNTPETKCVKDNTQLHLIRTYAAQIRRVADAYLRLETMAKASENPDFHKVVAYAGRVSSTEV